MQTQLDAKSLVLVVGAGASKEVNLPIGSELKRSIATALDIRNSDRGFNQVSGDRVVTAALRELVTMEGSRSGVIDHYIHACHRIRDNMPQAASIDNFIDGHRDDSMIAQCGKLAIARCILEAEQNSKLYINPSNIYNKLDFEGVQHTWFNAFFRLLVEGCQKQDMAERMSRVAIITFNYDRCIEQYLYEALISYYGLEPQAAVDMLSNLTIYHPYGFLGPLPWQSPRGAIKFGEDADPRKLVEISKNLRTFTEGTDKSHSDIINIRSTMHTAERVVFLGFSFNPQNVELLYRDHEVRYRDCPVYGSAYGMSESDVAMISGELASYGGHPNHRIHLNRNLKCAEVFSEYGRSMSLR
ncbi:SIR2 family protein [Herbaspirillum sp. GCM10030257]|uniref:SIR2 family protein n=1 Tax=Herbaspirillum sp. GCM10030257 TaxID=3273393 RepID=UPI00360C9BB2